MQNSYFNKIWFLRYLKLHSLEVAATRHAHAPLLVVLPGGAVVYLLCYPFVSPVGSFPSWLPLAFPLSPLSTFSPFFTETFLGTGAGLDDLSWHSRPLWLPLLRDSRLGPLLAVGITCFQGLLSPFCLVSNCSFLSFPHRLPPPESWAEECWHCPGNNPHPWVTELCCETTDWPVLPDLCYIPLSGIS